MKTKRKISIRKILQVVLTVLVSTGCIIAIVSASRIDDNQTATSVAVHIKNDKKYHFIEQKEIMDLAINNRNIDVEHTPLSKLDIHSMERLIEADPWVANAQVFVDNAHVLQMYVTQRIPVVRMFQTNSVSYYLDTTLSIMPLSTSNIYYTTVVTNVPELTNDSASWALRKQIVSLVQAIQADSFWSAQVSQVIVDSDATFELLPVLGDQRILFGDATRINEKLNNLFVFYKKVLNRIGWDKYETLDVRFKGQVVASPSLPYKGPVDKAIVNMNWINSIVETEARKDSAHGQDIKMKPAMVAAVPIKPVVKANTKNAPQLSKQVKNQVKNQANNKAAQKSGKNVEKKNSGTSKLQASAKRVVAKPLPKNKHVDNVKKHDSKQVKPKYILQEKK